MKYWHVFASVCLCLVSMLGCGDKAPQPQDMTGGLQRVLDELSRYEYGDSQDWRVGLWAVSQSILVNPEARRQAEGLVIDFLRSEASEEAKDALVPVALLFVSEASEGALIELLEDETAGHASLQILCRAGLGDGDELMGAAKRLPPEKAIPLIDELGNRREEAVIQELAKLARDSDQGVANAAVWALGQIGNLDAVEHLESFAKLPAGPGHDWLTEARLVAAQRVAETGQTSAAVEVYRAIADSAEDLGTMHRAAALRGLFKSADDPVEFLKEAIRDAPKQIRRVLIGLAYELPDEANVGEEFLRMEELSLEDRTRLFTVFAHRGDTSIHDLAMKYVRDGDADLHMAALRVLPPIGKAKDLADLVRLAAHSTGDEQDLAQEALARIQGKDIDEELANLLVGSEPAEQLEILKAIAERSGSAATETVLKVAGTGVPEVQRAALRTLAAIAPLSSLDEVMGLVSALEDPALIRGASRALYRLAYRHPDRTQALAALEVAVKEAGDPETKQILAEVLEELAAAE